MKRRDFLGVACAAGIGAATMSTAATAFGDDEKKPPRRLIELRQYMVADFDKKKKLIEVFDNALIPGLNRLGINPVGVFDTDTATNENKADYNLAVFVLFQHDNPESLYTTTPKLLRDQKFLEEAGPIFETTSKDPLYTGCKSTLMYGFENCPGIEIPTDSKERLMQIRYYRSFNPERNESKVHMFDHGSELAIFRKYGMPPVFFGTTLFGDYMPNLTYMLGFANKKAKDDGWKAFVGSDEWKVLSKDPLYKDTATEITNIVLRPSGKSQI